MMEVDAANVIVSPITVASMLGRDAKDHWVREFITLSLVLVLLYR